jgi:gamma-glutamyltranspeptidase/glutathione hydrolase
LKRFTLVCQISYVKVAYIEIKLIMSSTSGIVAAGHRDTAKAASTILEEGGNAFDACLAALLASCITEPVLSSLGGGGFMLAHPEGNEPILYDFFAHTPSKKPSRQILDFYPIVADFGTAQQEFHIGMGSIAVPGVARGIFAMHQDLCRMPLRTIAEPAIRLAQRGVEINSFQHYISTIVSPIIKSSQDALKIHESINLPGEVATEGKIVLHQDLADTLSALIQEGDDLFYRGELAKNLAHDCKINGGAICRKDLEQYEVIKRPPLETNYCGTKLLTNPTPSIGGILIAFSLSLLDRAGIKNCGHHSIEHLSTLAHVMKTTQQLRHDHNIDSNFADNGSNGILSEDLIESYLLTMNEHASFSRGTTQISVADNKGNIASMTLSNGEGSGYVLPGTGIMLNNMLGEEDLNPLGFHEWPINKRIASMMAPTIALKPNGDMIATGSGGSNRIRSAILQVLTNIIEFDKTVSEAVEEARIHFENGLLNLEAGIPDETRASLTAEFPKHHVWPKKNLFFGGAHTVARSSKEELYGKGDSRRGGVCITT